MPLLKALRMPRVSPLIADDIGLQDHRSGADTPEGSQHLPWDLLIVDECHNLMPSPWTASCAARCHWRRRDSSIGPTTKPPLPAPSPTVVRRQRCLRPSARQPQFWHHLT